MDKGHHIPVVFGLLATSMTYMVWRDLATGEIWRGPGLHAVVSRVEDPGHFYGMVGVFGCLAVIFWGGMVWALFMAVRRKRK